MRNSHFTALRLCLRPLVALAGATALAGCVAVSSTPSPYYYSYNYPTPYYSGYTVSEAYPSGYATSYFPYDTGTDYAGGNR